MDAHHGSSDIQMVDSASSWRTNRLRQQKGYRDHRLGRSRGGPTTKIHTVIDAMRKGFRSCLGLVEAVLQQAAPSRAQLIECFFSRLKHFRRIATRYDKLADNFLAMIIQLASMGLWAPRL